MNAKLIILLAALLIVFNATLFGQSGEFSKGDKVAVTMKSGAVHEGELIEIDELYLKIKPLIISSVSKYKLEDIESISKMKIAKTASLGAGLGIDYGVLGINGEVNIGNHLAVTAGVGTTMFAGLGYNFGVRGYILNRESMFRPRLGIHFGTGYIIQALDLSDYVAGANYDGQKFNAFAFSAGTMVWLTNDHKYGLCFDLVYLGNSSECSSTIDKMNNQITLYNKRAKEDAYYSYYQYQQIEMPFPVKVSMGCRIAF